MSSLIPLTKFCWPKKVEFSNGAAGANPNEAQQAETENKDGNVYDADYKVEDDGDKK